ncbi:MAG: DNA replication/repair protein RecF [Sphingomonadaceae bacterium]
MPPPVPAHILSLSLAHFRNHAATSLAPDHASAVVLTGPNGAGKTNILEAISLLSVGRGLRGATLSAMAMQGPDAPGGFQLAAALATGPDLPAVSLRTGTMPEEPNRRQLRVNGAPAALSTLGQWLSLLWVTPAMDRLFADSASARRRFLDRMTLTLAPGHAAHASRYDAAMRARTRLLTADTPADPEWLSALEVQMASHGAALADARAETVAALSAELAALPAGPFPRPALTLAGDDARDLGPRLVRSRAADAAAGRATVGPHRADLDVVHAEKTMPAALASTGEQKALLVAILLAQASLVARRTGRTLILLLDEAVAHLDADRRAALFDRLAGLGGQSWLSGTDATLFAGMQDAAHFSVQDGAARRTA